MTDSERDTSIRKLEDFERRARRITDRYIWLRLAVFATLFTWLYNSYPKLPYMDGRSWMGIWMLAYIGGWEVSGWLLDLPALIFPEVKAFQHLRRPAPRREPGERL